MRRSGIKKTTNDFITDAKLVHGDVYDYSKVEYVNSKTKVCIICPIHGEFWQVAIDHLSKCGCPICSRNKKKKLKYGVGINDLDESLSNHISYIVWHSMLQRCYSEKYQNIRSTYIGCTVCEEWHLLSNFKKWFNENYIEGYHLDKDILVKGNKVYSPDTCCFVPIEINCLVVPHYKKGNKFLIGVKERELGRYSVKMKNKIYGTYDTKEEAFNTYKKVREAYIKDIAKKYFNEKKIDKKVFDALIKYEILFIY